MDLISQAKVEEIYFTKSQDFALVIASHIVSSISLVSSLCVLVAHIILLFYRSNIVNRLSLRLIVLTSIFDCVYSACQVATDHISSQSISCRAIAYILISTDTMACMCLAVVGLNLVMIFAIRVSNTLKYELLYYLAVVASGILVTMMPRLVGDKTGPGPNALSASCWYHYYFEGRMHNHFNWLWYYGWLLFSAVFAMIVAIISIFFVVKARGNFASTLDMQSRRADANINSTYIAQKNRDTTSVFKKITIRCIWYPLVPLITKIWGISLELAIVSHATIPFSLFFLDRLFSGLQGFMVACIYFTDPAISMVFSEMKDNVKKTYVYDYYEMLFEPGSNSNSPSSFPKLVKVAPVQTDRSQEEGSHLVLANNLKKDLLDNIVSEEVEIRRPASDSRSNSGNTEKNVFVAPYLVLCMVKGQRIRPGSKNYDIVAAVFGDGKTFIPNENNRGLNPRVSLHESYRNARKIPLKVLNLSQPPVLSTYARTESNFSEIAKNSEAIKYLAPFRSPRWAKFVHWIMVFVFRTKSIEPIQSEEMSLDTEEKSIKKSVPNSNTSPRNSTNGSDRSKQITESFSTENMDDFATSKNLKDALEDYTVTVDLSSPLKNATKSFYEESSMSKKPPSIDLAVLHNYDDASGINTLIDDNMDISSSSATKDPTPSNSSMNKNFLRKNSRPTPSIVWNILKPPRSESFSTIAQVNEIGNAIELQKIDTAPNAPNSDSSHFKESAHYDTCKQNTPASLKALRNDLYIQDTSNFTNQLSPRPLSQYPKGKAPKRDRIKCEFVEKRRENTAMPAVHSDLAESSRDSRREGDLLPETHKKSTSYTFDSLLSRDDVSKSSENGIE